jgi:predicted RNase H-like HicB family nuclease
VKCETYFTGAAPSTFATLGFSVQVFKFGRLTMKYKIVLNKTDEGYSVSCPGLPGCWSQGKTEAEAIDNIKDAIQEYLAAVYASVKDSNVREVEIAI